MSIVHRLERIERVLCIEPRPITIGPMVKAYAGRTVARHVCREMGLQVEQLQGATRDFRVGQARAGIAWLCRRNLGRTLAEIGAINGTPDHSSVAHQLRRAEEMLANDRTFRQEMDIVSRRLFRKPVA